MCKKCIWLSERLELKHKEIEELNAKIKEMQVLIGKQQDQIREDNEVHFSNVQCAKSTDIMRVKFEMLASKSDPNDLILHFDNDMRICIHKLSDGVEIYTEDKAEISVNEEDTIASWYKE